MTATCNLKRLQASGFGSRGAKDVDVTIPVDGGFAPPPTGGSQKDGSPAGTPSAGRPAPSHGAGTAAQTGPDQASPAGGNGSGHRLSEAEDGTAGALQKRRRKRRRRKSKKLQHDPANRAISGARPVQGQRSPASAKSPQAATGSTASAGTHDGKPRARRHGSSPPPVDPKPQPARNEQPLPFLPAGPPPRPVLAQGSRRRAPLYAALDLGTNNCRLLIAAPTAPGQFRVVDAFSRIVRLGEGLTASGRLSDAAMNRALDALRICATKLAARDIRALRLIATEACRSAANGQAFLDRVLGETGLALEIVDRETEARLAVCGCGSLVERHVEGIVLFDIGGGSSEIALVDLSGRRSSRLSDHIAAWTSLPVGVVSLAERFGGKHVTRDVFETMTADVASRIAGFADRHALNGIAAGDRFHLLGTSGTVTTLAGIYLGLERYDRRKVDGIWLENDQVTEMTERLLSWDFEQRVANPCIGPDRADLVLAGCAILEAIRRTWPSPRLRVADRGLREGILTELMSADGAWRRGRRTHWRQPS